MSTLTLGEEKLAHSVFGGAINYNLIRILRKKYLFFQPENVVMAPNGNI